MEPSRDNNENEDGALATGDVDMPSKKSSFNEQIMPESTAPTKPPRSFYPLAQLEEMAKGIDYDSDRSVVPASPASQTSATFKTTESCKNRFAELAAKLDDFEVDTRPKHVTFANRRQENSPSRWGQAAATSSPVSNRYGRPAQVTPSKAVDRQTGDSGIESFYRQRPIEDEKESEAVAEVVQTGDSNRPVEETPKAVSPKPATSAVTCKSVGNSEPKKLGGLANLLAADRASAASSNRATSASVPKPAPTTGKVSQMAGAWEKQIRNTATDKSPAPKPVAKIVAASVSRERTAGSAVTSSPVRSTIEKPATQPKKAVSSGIDSRRPPVVNKLVNRFERVAQTGTPLNPDDSICESDPLTETAVRMFQTHQAPAKQPVIQQLPRQQTPTKEKSPTVKDTVSVVPKPPKTPEPVSVATDDVDLDNFEMPTPSTATKSPKMEDSSHNSSALSDYLNEAISCAQAAAVTPPKPASNGFTVAGSVDYPTYSQQVEPARPAAPLVYTVSIYRKMVSSDQSGARPQSVVVVPPMSPVSQSSPAGIERKRTGTASGTKFSPSEYDDKIKALMEKIMAKQTQIAQLSRAINMCKEKEEFRASIEEVEAQKNLLICTEHRRCLIDERNRLEDCYRNRMPFSPPPPHGTLTINRITLPLQRSFFNQMANFPTDEICYFMCILKFRDTFHVTQMISIDDANQAGELTFSNYIQFHNLPPDFAVSLEVYVLRTVREQLTHQEKYRLDGSKSGTLAKQRTLRGLFSSGASQASNMTGPAAVADTTFRMGGRMSITLESVDRRRFSLHDTQYGFPLEGGIHLDLRCVPDSIGVEPESGFLNCYEEVGGTAAWKRLWTVLDGDYLKFWKYPEDEQDGKRPVFEIDLKTCTSDSVGAASLEITSRPNSFAFDTSDGYSFILSSDTKNEQMTWCRKLNEFLRNVRLWTVGDRH